MSPEQPSRPSPTRRDGWTRARRRRFIGALAAGDDVRRACVQVGLSRQAAYKLRRREPAFASAWDAAQAAARSAAETAFIECMPDALRRRLEAHGWDPRAEATFLPLDRVTPGPSV